MAYEIQILKNDRVMMCTFSGRINYTEIDRANNERILLPAFKNIRIWVSDYTDATFGDVCSQDVQKSVDFSERAIGINPKVTIVGVMPEDFAYGMSRMWQALADHLPWKSHVVRTREEATALVDTLLKAMG